jgi:hypothetical protein
MSFWDALRSLFVKSPSRSNEFTHFGSNPDNFDPDDITTYPINDIKASGRFTAEERRREYRRRGKSPSGVIDGVYNDEYRGNDSYNDIYRDWEADA